MQYYSYIFISCLLVVLISCGAGEEPTGKMPPVLVLGEKAPDFSFRSLIDSEQNPTKILSRLSQQKGKVVYLDFWASWCKPCLKSMPALDKLQTELKLTDFEILAVNLDSNPENGRAFIAKISVNYPVVISPKDDISKLYNLNGLPTSYLIDKQGVLRFAHQGFKEADLDQIKQQILSLAN